MLAVDGLEAFIGDSFSVLAVELVVLAECHGAPGR